MANEDILLLSLLDNTIQDADMWNTDFLDKNI